MDELLAETAARLRITGAQLAIAVDGELTEYATGVANAELGTPVTPDTLFQIGSTAKLHTAALVLGLVDEGRADLDAPVSEYLPELRLPGEGTLTPRHLLSMTSGLDNGPYVDTGRGDDCVARYAELLAEIPPVFAPGEGFGYSNASTVVSGLLIERLTGLTWDEALQRRLAGPAGLARTVSRDEDLVYHRVAVGHTVGGEVVRPWCFSRGLGPAGSTLCATAGDLARFGVMILGGGAGVLSPDAVATMQTPHTEVEARWFAEQWCAGPYRKVWDGTAVYGHGGTNLGGSSTLVWIPERNTALAVTVNTPSQGYPFADAVFAGVCADLLGLAVPVRAEPGLGLPVDASRYTGVYRTYDTRYAVTERPGGLAVTAESDGERLTCDLLPLGDHRFQPADDRLGGMHRWDVAFVPGPDGRATRFLNGAFAARRVSG
ncbi:serine hydrolase domain-containing protein [Rhizohabitans arisaemae]|uniref:serine hydrolase domain-containing protein n=1 Tax=Rhizohabitans arisaemae TaxID=2720610 RepID=UPI0024B066ED|nr:serine hydrolase domain-containing protein [Rhizohabitans arisaemae]